MLPISIEEPEDLILSTTGLLWIKAFDGGRTVLPSHPYLVDYPYQPYRTECHYDELLVEEERPHVESQTCQH
jgi:hypothetical protein